MPIKFAKGLRRKSTTNGLEDTATPVESSFRVLERPHSGSRSIDGTAALKHTQKDSETDPFPDNIFAGLDTQPKNNRYEDAFAMSGQEDSPHAHVPAHAHTPVPVPVPAKPVRNKWLTKLRGSSSTANTSSTGRPYDSSASSAKYSSSSTLPSSAGGSSHDVPRVPEAPYSFSLRAAGRTFSFGSKSKVPANTSSSRPQTKQSSLARPATTSTSSTATPPRLPENFKVNTESDWGDMFDGMDKRQSVAAPAVVVRCPVACILAALTMCPAGQFQFHASQREAPDVAWPTGAFQPEEKRSLSSLLPQRQLWRRLDGSVLYRTCSSCSYDPRRSHGSSCETYPDPSTAARPAL